MDKPKTHSYRLALVGAIAAYASIFSAFTGFVGLTWTLLVSSILLSLKAVGSKRLRQFFTDFLGA